MRPSSLGKIFSRRQIGDIFLIFLTIVYCLHEIQILFNNLPEMSYKKIEKYAHDVYITSHERRCIDVNVTLYERHGVVSTLMWHCIERHDIESTLMRRCINVMCPLGIVFAGYSNNLNPCPAE